MTPKSLRLIEKESVPKPKASAVMKAWEEYKEAEMEAAIAKRQLYEEARNKGDDVDIPRREQGALLREVRLMQAEKQAKMPVQAPQPVPEEKDDDMEEDEEEPEVEEEAEGTMETPIEVVAEVVAPREVPKPLEVKQKSRAEEVTTRTLPKRGDERATAMGQWAGGPPNDRRRVVVDEGPSRVGRRERREDEKGEDDESSIPVERNAEVESVAGPQTGGKEELAVPVFDDMKEQTVEIALWTKVREEALKKVTKEAMADEGELSPQVVDANSQKYKDMLSSLALRDATEEEYRKARWVGQPYRGMTRLL